MRKPIKEAVKWHNMKTDVSDKQGQDFNKIIEQKYGENKSSNTKVFQIEVLQCTNLRRSDAQFTSGAFNPKMMQPFFSFDFYTFEYRSPTASGNNPSFGVTQRYEVNYNQEFRDYQRQHCLKIDFIDESVDLNTQPEINDYIGSARIPLKDIDEKETSYTYPINNEKNQPMG